MSFLHRQVFINLVLLYSIFMEIRDNNKCIVLVYPTYFSPIIQYVALAKAENITFEVEDNYQKQTYRTRCYIYSPNGKQLLNIPVKNARLNGVVGQANSKQKTKDVQIEYSFDWQKQHIKSIEAAYRSSPFFEYYEDEIQAIYNSKPTFLLDFNLKCQDLIINLLQLDVTFAKTTVFEKTAANNQDMRSLADAKSTIDYELSAYTQVFDDKYGFIKNLSILDLLCMEGTNALDYLESQRVDFL